DLYDQLQLVQVLDWFCGWPGDRTRLNLICTEGYLGRLTGQQLAALWPQRHPVTQAELDLASGAWRAFRSPDPNRYRRTASGRHFGAAISVWRARTAPATIPVSRER